MANRGTYVNWPELYASQASIVAAGLTAGDTCTVAGTALTWTLEDGVYWWHSIEAGSLGSPSNPYPSFSNLLAALPSGPTEGIGGTSWYLLPNGSSKAYAIYKATYGWVPKVSSDSNPKPGVVLIAGDSISASTASTGGWSTVLAIKSKGLWALSKNIAVGGYTLAQIRAAINGFTPSNQSILIVEGGTNQGASFAQDISDIVGIIISAMAKGLRVYVSPCPPLGSGSPDLHAYIQRFNAALPGICSDLEATLLTPWTGTIDLSTGFMATTASVEGDATAKHPKQSKQIEKATGDAALLFGGVAETPLLLSSAVTTEITKNVLFGTNTAGLPTNWTNNGGFSVSCSQSGDGVGNRFAANLDYTGASTSKTITSEYTGLSGGIKYRLACRIGHLAALNSYNTIRIVYADSAGTEISRFEPHTYLTDAFDGRLVHEFIAPANCARLQFYFIARAVSAGSRQTAGIWFEQFSLSIID